MQKKIEQLLCDFIGDFDSNVILAARAGSFTKSDLGKIMKSVVQDYAKRILQEVKCKEKQK